MDSVILRSWYIVSIFKMDGTVMYMVSVQMVVDLIFRRDDYRRVWIRIDR
jgi:hypothetical protein